VVVRINDRGPFIGGRIIDLSKAAAESIGMLGAGTAQVRISTTAPDGGSALAALGDATAKAKKGVALAAKESAEAEPHHAANTAAPARLIEARNRPTKTLKPTAVASLSQVHAKTKVAAASFKTKKVTVGHSSQAKIAVAWEPPRSKKTARIAAKGTRSTHVAVSYSYKPGARTSARGHALPSAHPYAIFVSTPGFMQPAAS
jgi:rare lipoprotein A